MENENLEYILKQEVSNFIKEKIKNSIDKYFEDYKSDIGFLLYYPLITLEKRFSKNQPELIQQERTSISWFIKEVMAKGYNKNLNFNYNEKNREKFEKGHYKEILNLYDSMLFSEEVKVVNPLICYEFGEIIDNTIRITKPVIKNKYSEMMIYHTLAYDDQQHDREMSSTEAINNYIIEQYLSKKPTPESFAKLMKLSINFDPKLYSVCEERVVLDLEKLGRKVKSYIVRNVDELKSIISSFYYLCKVKQITQGLFVTDDYLEFDQKTLIANIKEMTNLNENTIMRYISYFNLETGKKGTITHFPLICYNNKVIFIPSSFILNDWHFNLVNGHYHKNIEFKNRDKTISNSFIRQIISKASEFTNLIHCEEKIYIFNIDKQSDIDVALFDKNSNKMLVIECKWISKHFISEEENYSKVLETLKEIYRDQISKHTEYFNLGKDSLNHIFDNHPFIESLTVQPEIYYIALDKRSQFHINDRHMITFFMLLYMMDQFTVENELNLSALIQEIHSLKTTTTYFDINKKDIVTFEVCGLKFNTDKLVI
jgi:hypothetical protein